MFLLLDGVEHECSNRFAGEREIPPGSCTFPTSIGQLALLVVLETLGPAERLAFVSHDMFAVPFDEIASIVGRSPAAVRQLASRARAAGCKERSGLPTPSHLPAGSGGCLPRCRSQWRL